MSNDPTKMTNNELAEWLENYCRPCSDTSPFYMGEAANRLRVSSRDVSTPKETPVEATEEDRLLVIGLGSLSPSQWLRFITTHRAAAVERETAFLNDQIEDLYAEKVELHADIEKVKKHAVQLEKCINGALRVSDLWLPPERPSPQESQGEYETLHAMHRMFSAAMARETEEGKK